MRNVSAKKLKEHKTWMQKFEEEFITFDHLRSK